MYNNKKMRILQEQRRKWQQNDHKWNTNPPAALPSVAANTAPRMPEKTDPLFRHLYPYNRFSTTHTLYLPASFVISTLPLYFLTLFWILDSP